MKRLKQRSVADSFSNFIEDEERDFTLQDGSRIAVIGGGPAGSFFSFFLLKMAQAIDLDIEVEVASIGEAYTPAGSISQIPPAGSISQITPAGSISQITPAGSISQVTPAGTNTAPAFTGAAMSTHTHTLSGAGAVAAPLAELGNVAVAAVTLYLLILGL